MINLNVVHVLKSQIWLVFRFQWTLGKSPGGNCRKGSLKKGKSLSHNDWVILVP